MQQPEPNTRQQLASEHILTDNHGSAMIFVLVITIILNIVVMSVFFSSKVSNKTSSTRRVKVASLNIAEAGKEHFYAQLLNKQYNPQANAIDVVFDNVTLGNGAYTVICITGSNPDTLTIRAIGYEAGDTTELEIISALVPELPLDGVLAHLPGAVTARSPIYINGTIDIDGRDYDSLDNLTGSAGVNGVYTCLDLTFQGNADVGGNGNPLIRGKKASAAEIDTVAEQYTAIAPYLASPEAFLGVPPGSLDKFKTGTVPSTFHGIVYDTVDDAGVLHIGGSSGILIVHNSSKTATVQINANGTFKGLIIVDNMDKFTGGITGVGAVAVLGTAETMFGNGTANLHYSSQVLGNLASYCNNIGFKIDQLSWREIR